MTPDRSRRPSSRWLSAILFTASAASVAAPTPLSRADAVRLGLERSHDLRAKQADQRRTDALALAARQAYGPSLFASTGASRVPSSTGQDTRQLDAALGASWKTTLGTQLTGQLETTQALPGSPGTVADSAVSVSVSQPLLKDGWTAGASLPLIEARLNAIAQTEVYKAQLNTFLVEVETGYWDLALAQADVAVKTRSRERAQAQYEDTAENIKRGILAETELFLVQENVVIFDQDLLRAREDLAQAQRHLAELLVAAATERLEASDALTAPAILLPERAAALEQAQRTHPKVLERKARLELAQARQALASNQALPALGLTGALALRGWDSGQGSSWSQLATQPAAEVRAGLSFALPLDRPAVDAALARARVDVDQAEAELAKAELAVRAELDAALGQLALQQQVLSLSKRQVELAEAKLKAQVEKYQSGLSTLADVVRFQRDVDNAASALQRVVRSTRVGEARLLAAVGTLAEERAPKAP